MNEVVRDVDPLLVVQRCFELANATSVRSYAGDEGLQDPLARFDAVHISQ